MVPNPESIIHRPPHPSPLPHGGEGTGERPSTPEESPPDACPPPLLWHDVRSEFLAQSREIKISTPAGTASVRVLGTGKPLYLLPGFTSPAELYCLLTWLLRDEFRCVTIEPDETSRKLPRTMGDYASLCGATMDELGDQQAIVFGANFGAAWALATARQFPERVSRLALLHGFARRRLSVWERQLAWLCGWSRRTLNALPYRAELQTQNHRRWFPPFDASRWQYYLDATGRMPLAELGRRAAAVSSFDLRAELPRIAAPTLLIHTEGEGRVAEAAQQELEQKLPHATVEWLHSTGQLPYLTHPHRLAKLLRGEPQEPRTQ